MSLRLDVGMIFSLQARSTHIVQDSTGSHIRAHIWSWHIANARNKAHHGLYPYVQDGRWMRNVFNSDLCDLISLH